MQATWAPEIARRALDRDSRVRLLLEDGRGPLRVLELPSIRALLAGGTVVVCGCGEPVANRDGEWVGIDAPVDVHRVAALLAHDLGATVRTSREKVTT